MISRPSANSSTTQVQILALLISIAVVPLVYLFAMLYKSTVGIPPLEVGPLLPAFQANVFPEPIERLSYQITILLVLFVLGVFADKIFAQRKEPGTYKRLSQFMPLLLVASLSFPLSRLNFGPLPWVYIAREHGSWLSTLAAAVLLCGLWVWLEARQHRVLKRYAVVGVIAGIVLFNGAMFLEIVASRIFNDHSISRNPIWYNSFDAMVYAVSQVAAGKTLLVDLPSQYGLYPEILGLVFAHVKLSVLSLTGFFAVLQIVALSVIVLVSRKVIKSQAINIMFSLALVMITFHTAIFVMSSPDPYYQYWPIRFFWPAVSVLTFYFYSQRRTYLLAAITSLTGAVGAVWNADSGLMIEIAFGAYLVAKLMVSLKWPDKFRRDIQRHLLIVLAGHVGIFVLVLATFFLYLMAKSGSQLNWFWLFEYQRIFYQLGFMMMPLPLYIHPWMAVLGLYLVGILFSFSAWVRYPASRTADFVFLLSFLGLGLFLYYQGRSHDVNLISVSWPALLLLALLADRALRAVRVGIVSRSNLVVPLFAMVILAHFASPLVVHFSYFYSSAISIVKNFSKDVDPLVADEMRFIKSHAKPGTQCLILALRQGIYHAESGTASPIVGPGYIETLMRADLESLVTQMQNTRVGCIFIGVGPNSTANIGVDPLSLLKGYSITAQNRRRSILFLTPKNG